MGKKSIVIWGWIFVILLFGTVVSAVVLQFMEKSDLLFITLIIFLLVILESVCIICLVSFNIDEKMKKFELLEQGSLSKNIRNGEKELAQKVNEKIYKIFCNTLVDL